MSNVADAAHQAVNAQEQLLNSGFLADTLFWTGISFAILLAVVWKYATPGILGKLDERAARIREDLDRANLLRNEAQQALAKYETQLKSARKEAHDILATAKSEAEKLVAARTADLDRDLARRSEEARVSIEQAKAAALREVRSEIASLAMAAAEKILTAEVDAKKASQLTDEALSELKH